MLSLIVVFSKVMSWNNSECDHHYIRRSDKTTADLFTAIPLKGEWYDILKIQAIFYLGSAEDLTNHLMSMNVCLMC